MLWINADTLLLGLSVESVEVLDADSSLGG
jgi:hypothetical protein